jgi:glycosyltransferase involved in cell wall biosynthesis
MKILYLITKSNWGGAQRYVYDLATSFDAKGVTTLVAFGGHGLLAENLEKAGIKTFSISSLERDIALAKELFVLRDFYKLIKREQPDILHLNSSKASGIGALIGRLLGIKQIVVTIHGAPFREDRRFFVKKLMYFFTWLTCLLAHKVITVSRQDESDIGAMFFIKKKVTTIYLGLTYDPTISQVAQKERKVHIVTVGELSRNKGYLYALQAMDILKQKGLLFSYSIIGEGEDRQKIEEFISLKQLGDVVSMLGYQDARSVLHQYDIYFLPSTKEGLPFVLLEAGKAMLPVVATITGGVPEVIRHEETGLLAQPKDIDELAKCLERLIADRKYAKKLGQALHSHVVQHFSFSKMLVETAKVYGLIESKK